MKSYKHRVNRREFLNTPGHHGGAYIVAYVEDTPERPAELGDSYDHNPQPRLILEIADCSERISLEFELHSAHARHNSFYKVDTLIAILSEFRQGMIEESKLVRRRAEEIRRHEEKRAGEQDTGDGRRHAQRRRSRRQLL